MISSGIYYNLSDEDYHKQYPWDEHYFSSSQLKTVLEDPRMFHEQYIVGKRKEVSQAMQDAFDVGTVVHTAILEPKKLKGSYAKWEGGNRTGKVWDDFLSNNVGKLILNKTMLSKANNAISAFKKSELSKELYRQDNGSKPEVSFFTEFMGLRIKVRADLLTRQGVIRDIKTSTGNVRDEKKIKNKVKDAGYDLSAALYVDVVNHCIKEFEIDVPPIKDFEWLFLSKDEGGFAQNYSAHSFLPLGRAKYRKAIELIHKHQSLGWKFPEEIVCIEPNGYELVDWKIKQSKKEGPSDEELL